jgi:hypothetical protein
LSISSICLALYRRPLLSAIPPPSHSNTPSSIRKMAAYIEVDQADRAYFEDVLRNDIERLAFIQFFTHVERDFARNRRTYLPLYSDLP